MADYLLLHLTDVQVFMDLRAQAAYSPGNFEDFFATIDTGPGKTETTLEILDRYDVALWHLTRFMPVVLVTLQGPWW